GEAMPRFAASRFTFLSMLALAPMAAADDPKLSDFFGFSSLEIVKIDQDGGPIAVADMNGDGLHDLIGVNNFKSRIEIHYQKAGATPADEIAPTSEVNDLPEHWRFRRQ